MFNPLHPGEALREDILPALDLSVTERVYTKSTGLNIASYPPSMQEAVMTEHRTDDGEKVVNRAGRPAALTPQHILLLRESVTRMPHATLDELAAELDHLGEVRVCAATIRRTLRAQGLVRLMPVRRAGGKSVGPAVPVAAPKRYGYTAAHRREAGQYSTDYRCRMALGL